MKNLLLLFLAFVAYDLSAQCEIDSSQTDIISIIPCPSLVNEDTCGFNNMAFVGDYFEEIVYLYGPEQIDLPPLIEFNQFALPSIYFMYCY